MGFKLKHKQDIAKSGDRGMPPKFTRPGGRADLDRTTDHLIEYFRTKGRGLGSITSGPAIASMYGISLGQAQTVADRARSRMRFDDENLCARPGQGGGYFLAETEEEARQYGLLRTGTSVTHIQNVIKDAEAALRGVVRTVPSTGTHWVRARKALSNIAGALGEARLELGSAEATDDE